MYGGARSTCVAQPELGYTVTLETSPSILFQHLWAPAGEDFLCIEPISHRIDAFSTPANASPHLLAPGATIAAEMRLSLAPLDR
jgi:aldose 1-epimerase